LVFGIGFSHYLAGGIRADARRGPMELWSRVLFDRMIRDSHQRGLTFDFEGSMLPGVEQFFRGWGGVRMPIWRVIKMTKPWTYAMWSLHRFLTGHRKKPYTPWMRADGSQGGA